MPRKDRNVRKHGKLPAQYNKQGEKKISKQQSKTSKDSGFKESEKVKLRTSKDVYNRLWNDSTLNINLNDVSIGYWEGKYNAIAEMAFTEFELIENGGDIPLHKIEYFRFNDLMLWNKNQRLDRLWGSGNTQINETWSNMNDTNNNNNNNINNNNDNHNDTVVTTTNMNSQQNSNSNNNNNESKENENESKSMDNGISELEMPNIIEHPTLEYLIVLDFEATCDGDINTLPGKSNRNKKDENTNNNNNNNKKNNKNESFERRWNPIEIIEWPAMIIDIKNEKILNENENVFHYYIKPRINAKLTPFCSELTGITQSMIDENNYDISEIYYKWIEFIENMNDKYNININNSAIVTCGDWDLKQCWIQQRNACNWPNKIDIAQNGNLLNVISNSNDNNNNNNNSNLMIDERKQGALLMNLRWINVKTIYSKLFNSKAGGMMSMLKLLNIKHRGRHHSGIDDVKNIAQIVLTLLKKGATFEITTAWPFHQTGNFKKKRNFNDWKLKPINSRNNKKEENEEQLPLNGNGNSSKNSNQAAMWRKMHLYGVVEQHCNNAINIVDALMDYL